MALRSKTARMISLTSALLVGFIIGGFAFVNFFMHSVYEEEEMLEGKAVPVAVRENFEKRFPGATVDLWEVDDGLYTALFSWRAYGKIEAGFHPSGPWAATEYAATVEDLPKEALAYLERQKGYEVTEVEKIELPGSIFNYEVELSNDFMEWDCLFDAKGVLLEKERDGPTLE